MTAVLDALVIGSGPAGVHAALRLLERGLNVGMVDIGFSDSVYAPRIPDAPWSELRASDPEQAEYFLGSDPLLGLTQQARAGAHLTPPRQHMIHRSSELFPTTEDGLFALQATAQGGLGASWGANCFTYSKEELQKAGLPSLAREYEELARAIGVSGDRQSDLSPLIAEFASLQPALFPDDNAQSILNLYKKKARGGCLGRSGLRLGPSQLAALTQSLTSQDDTGRRPHAYHDMDFWSDHGESVYRPIFTLRKLLRHARFQYFGGLQATRFERSSEHCWYLFSQSVDGQEERTFCARRLLLAAGAINSARLVARSSAHKNPLDFPLLCNANRWVACVNWQMLGRPARDRRHSLSQLTALMPTSAQPGADLLVAHLYSYRSLMLFRLISEMPVPPLIALPILRVLSTALTLVNVQWADDSRSSHRLVFTNGCGPISTLRTVYRTMPEKTQMEDVSLHRLLRALLRLGVIPMKQTRPLPGASIHYAGTMPRANSFDPLKCQPSGELWAFPGVWSADSASWKWLPAKGLTFTIMAGARQIANAVADSMAARQ